MYSPIIEGLIEQFAQFPGVGRKSAERMAFFVLDIMSEADAESFAETVKLAKKSVKFCEVCQNLTDVSPCPMCASGKRDSSVICVVEQPKDVSAIEKTGGYSGLYHVLHGAISPMDNVGPDDIKIKELMSRVTGGEVREVIMATNPNLEGETTAMYISKLMKPFGVKVTRIAHGVPVGGELEYADEITLAKALQWRIEL